MTDELIEQINARQTEGLIFTSDILVETEYLEALEFRILGDVDVVERWRSMWEKEQLHNEELSTELANYKVRAERAEEALREALKEGISEPGQRVYNMAISALAAKEENEND